ncbi:MAG: hypothetical protein H7Z76_09455 [Methylotenera sp.]|nr:hypothetical protein [Flavobacterium sp.]
MKNLLILSTMLFSVSTFAGQIDVTCTKVLSGNYTGLAYTNIKSIDFKLSIDPTTNHAELQGTYITSAGKYHRENESVGFYTSFYKKSFSINGPTIIGKNHENNFPFCGSSGPVCHTWEEFSYNTKTGEASFAESHSYNNFGGNEIPAIAVKFICQ